MYILELKGKAELETTYEALKLEVNRIFWELRDNACSENKACKLLKESVAYQLLLKLEKILYPERYELLFGGK